MGLVPFSQQYPNEFLSRREDNIEILLKKIQLFFNTSQHDTGGGVKSRRVLTRRFNYGEELSAISIKEEGISSEEVALEFSDLLQGSIRHQDPTTAFNIIPAPLLDVVAGITLMSLYNPNPCWDFISGKLCLYEKKIVRMLGSLVGWKDAAGFAVTGGKQAIAYAIKNGMARASLNAPTELSDYVVLCSKQAHYSIEHVCHYLGISPENCIRLDTEPTGEMKSESLQLAMRQVIAQDKRIAAIIAVGGGTVNLIPDDISAVKEAMDSVVYSCGMDYIPYLHVDSVISWAWLTFDAEKNDCLDAEFPRVKEKIYNVLSKLKGISLADSFAADFHKTGFCPYAAGVFIAKNNNGLSGMSLDRSIPKEDILFGEFEPYKHTFENSRSGLAIASIWIALRRMGLEGIRKFIVYQLEVCENFKKKIRDKYSEHFEVLNDHSNGWEIVLKPHFGVKKSWEDLQAAQLFEQIAYLKYCQHFLKALWFDPLTDTEDKASVIGFVKNYSRKGSYEKSFPAFLIHPTSLHYEEGSIDEMLEGIIRTKIKCEDNLEKVGDEDPDYLLRVTPPK